MECFSLPNARFTKTSSFLSPKALAMKNSTRHRLKNNSLPRWPGFMLKIRKSTGIRETSEDDGYEENLWIIHKSFSYQTAPFCHRCDRAPVHSRLRWISRRRKLNSCFIIHRRRRCGSIKNVLEPFRVRERRWKRSRRTDLYRERQIH